MSAEGSNAQHNTYTPFFSSRDDKDGHSNLLLYQSRLPPSRSPSPERGENELLLRGQAARKGSGSAIAISVAGIQFALERRSLRLKIAVLGSWNPEVINIMAELANSWSERGMWSEVEKLELRILDFRQQTVGASHEATLEAMISLGCTWEAQGKYFESEKLYVTVFEGRKEALGRGHIDTVRAMLKLGDIWCAQRRYDKAEIAQRHVLDARRKKIGTQHWAMSMLRQTMRIPWTVLDTMTKHKRRNCKSLK